MSILEEEFKAKLNPVTLQESDVLFLKLLMRCLACCLGPVAASRLMLRAVGIGAFNRKPEACGFASRTPAACG